MSTPVTMAAVVDGVPASPPEGGLVSLARIPPETDKRWLGGYSYLSELPAKTIRNRALLGSDASDNLGSGEDRTVIETVPWMLEVETTVSTFQMNMEDYYALANRLMEYYTSKLLEYELWTGELATDERPHRVLANDDAEIVTPGGSGVQRAIAKLAKAVSDAGMGNAMIHVPRDLGIMVPDGWRNDDTLKDHGFVVVSGTGYPGTGPAGTGDNWIYATEMVNVRLDDIIPIENGNGKFVRPSDNTVHVRVQRIGAVDFAGPVFACQVS